MKWRVHFVLKLVSNSNMNIEKTVYILFQQISFCQAVVPICCKLFLNEMFFNNAKCFQLICQSLFYCRCQGRSRQFGSITSKIFKELGIQIKHKQILHQCVENAKRFHLICQLSFYRQ